MQKAKSGSKLRLEIWLDKSVAKFIRSQMTKENESRKEAMERIINNAVQKQKAKTLSLL